MIKKPLFIALFLTSFINIFSQDFSNKGKDFWIGYGNHVRMINTGAAESMQIYLTSDVNTTGLVEIPSVSFTQTFTVTANQITVVNIPRTAALLDEGQYNHGIHVTAANNIVVYSFIYVNAISGATVCLPTNVLGREYYSVNFNQLSNEANSYSYFFVVATEDVTQVEIKPTQLTKGGKVANVPFTVTLNKGQIYQVLSLNDLTGSTIKSISSGSGGCKKIGVFCGSGKISIGCNGSATGSSDNLYQQIYPTGAWGKTYLTVPSTNQTSTLNFQTNYFRIIRPDPTTIVKLNGNVVLNTLFTNNFYYQFTSNIANFIEADKPILVAQYFSTSGGSGTTNCGNSSIGDPEMFYLNPIEQTINKVTVNSMQPSANTALTTHFINVVLRNVPGAINSFTLDGVNQVAKFVPVPTNTAFAYARFNVPALAHTLNCDSGFNAIAYGFGSAESYAYSAGSNVRDLYQYVTLQNQFATVNFPSTCKGTPFKFSITLPYQPVKLNWTFLSNPNLSPNADVINTSPVFDSTFVRDGKNLYVYKLAGFYNFNAAGTYNVRVLVNNPTSDGCSGDQEISYDVQVFDPPTANFTATNDGCATSPVQFTDISTTGGRPSIKWDWDFGDATTSTDHNPLKTFTAGGTFDVKFRVVTDVGCIKDTTKQITLSTPPSAKFGVNDTTCLNTILTFIDSSSIITGSIVKWYWDFGNGIKDTLTANTSRSIAYNATGPYTVSLIVESNTGCKSIAFTKTINVSPFPGVDFNLPGNVCLPIGAAAFTSTAFNPGTGTVGLSYTWNFGDGNTSTTMNPVHNYTSTGPFLVNLKVYNAHGCWTDAGKNLTTVYPRPTAIITTINEVCLRDSSTLVDASNGNGSAISKWFWNVGNGLVDTTQNLKYLFTSAGSKPVQLFIITDKGCISDTTNNNSIINPLPTAGLTVSTIRCETMPVTINENAVANVGTISNWYYDMGDGSVFNKTNSTAFTHIYTNWGNKQIKQVVTNSKGCVSDTSFNPLLINPQPKPGYILPEVCLADAAAIFIDTSKIADGTASSFTYAWNFGDPVFSTIPNPNTSTLRNSTHKYSAVGFYNVKLKVTSINQCIDSVSLPITVNGSIPKANFVSLNSAKLCSNDSVSIQNTSIVDFGTITRVVIVWDTVNAPNVRFLDDFPAPNKIYKNLYPNFQAPANKTIYVKFIAYSGGICRDSITKPIILNQSPRVQFVTMPGICNDTTTRLITQANEIGGVPGTFAFFGTGVSSTGIYTPNSVAPNTYPIKYVFTSNTFECRDSATKNITVWPSPQAKWGISSPQCERNAITFTDSSVANYSNIVSWQWNFGDGTTQNLNSGSTFTKTYAAAGNFPSSLKVVTDSGCRSTINLQPIKINYLPIVGFKLPSICLPDGRGTFIDTSIIGDNSEGLFSYNWNFGNINDPSGSTLKNPTHQFVALGPYTIKLIITSKDQCVDSSIRILNSVYPQPIANFVAVPDSICIGETIAFQDLSDGITSPPKTWNWNLAQGTLSGLPNPSKRFTDSGSFNISLHVFNGENCVSDTAIYPVVVLPYPKLEIGPDLFFLQGGLLTINPQFTFGTNLNYFWSPPTGLDTIDIRNPHASPLVDTRYVLQLTGIGGCTVSDSVFVTVLKAPVIPNAFSPNGDGINDTWKIQYLESYPGCTIQVYDRYGKLLFTSVGYGKDWNGSIQGQPLPIGTYYYIVDPKNGRQKMSGSVTILK